MVNCRDEYLSSELHQACRLGLVQHVEHLLFYRAEINATNLAGNTPLHICAATNQVKGHVSHSFPSHTFLSSRSPRGTSMGVIR